MSSSNSSVGYVRIVDLTNMCIKAFASNKQITTDESYVIKNIIGASHVTRLHQNPEEIFYQFGVLRGNFNGEFIDGIK